MREAKCQYFGTCGGCTAQHIPYDEQLEHKKQKFIGAIQFDAIEVFSDEEFCYRNRMDFIFHGRGIGLRKKQQWKITVDIKECSIANKNVQKLLEEVKVFFAEPDAFDVKKHSGTLKYAVIRAPKEDSSISFMLNEDSSRCRQAIEQIEMFAKQSSANNIMIAYAPAETDVSVGEECFVVKGSDKLKITMLGKKLQFPIQGFFQNNDAMAERMVVYVHDLLTKYETKNAQLLDLYGGVGTFGIVHAELFNKVSIVENVPAAIVAAKLNIGKNNIPNAEAICLDASKLKKLPFPRPLFVITDPPRSGMHPKTIEQLNVLNPEVIVYISCNVEQLAKDIPKLKQYKIKSAALFDLFPQTPHIEAVVELVRN